MATMLNAAPFAVSAGLKKKPTYEELINYIRKDPDRIKYPDRQATILRNSHWLTQLDGEGWNQLETQQSLERQNAMRTMLLQHMAGAYGLNFALLQHVVQRMNLRPVVAGGGGGPPPPPGGGRVWRGGGRGPMGGGGGGPPGGGGGGPPGGGGGGGPHGSCWAGPPGGGDGWSGPPGGDSWSPPGSGPGGGPPPRRSAGQSGGSVTRRPEDQWYAVPGPLPPTRPPQDMQGSNIRNLRPPRPDANRGGDGPSLNPGGPAQPLPPRQSFAQQALNTTLNVAGEAASAAIGVAAGTAAASAGLPAGVAEAIGTGVSGLVNLTTRQLANLISDMQGRARQSREPQQLNEGPLITQPTPPQQPAEPQPQYQFLPQDSSGRMSPASPASDPMSVASSADDMEDVVWQQMPSSSAAAAAMETDSDEYRRWQAEQQANAEAIAQTHRVAAKQAAIAQRTASILSNTDTVLQQAANALARIAEAQRGSAPSTGPASSASASVLPQFDGVLRPAPMKRPRPATFGDFPELTEALRIAADRAAPMRPTRPPQAKPNFGNFPELTDALRNAANREAPMFGPLATNWRIPPRPPPPPPRQSPPDTPPPQKKPKPDKKK